MTLQEKEAYRVKLERKIAAQDAHEKASAVKPHKQKDRKLSLREITFHVLPYMIFGLV